VEQNVVARTGFENLPEGYCCILCEAPKEEFVIIEETASVNN
jgi:rubredoxin